MFVRRKIRATPWRADWALVLVESVRTGSAVRQRFVCHLATYRIDRGVHEPARSAKTYSKLERRLKTLKLSPSEQAKVIRQVERWIPRCAKTP